MLRLEITRNQHGNDDPKEYKYNTTATPSVGRDDILLKRSPFPLFPFDQITPGA
ncbi:MAG: hypothetical protein ACE5J1_01630 [Nitrospiria bacterium]